MKSTDPACMTQEQILAELGEFLAAGFQRHISSSIGRPASDSDPQKPLAPLANVEAQCGPPRRPPSEHRRPD